MRSATNVEKVDDGTEQKKRELYKQRSDAAGKARAIIDAKFPYLNTLNNSPRARGGKDLVSDNDVSKGHTPLHTS
jgi:hypothetical protein